MTLTGNYYRDCQKTESLRNQNGQNISTLSTNCLKKEYLSKKDWKGLAHFSLYPAGYYKATQGMWRNYSL